MNNETVDCPADPDDVLHHITVQNISDLVGFELTEQQAEQVKDRLEFALNRAVSELQVVPNRAPERVFTLMVSTLHWKQPHLSVHATKAKAESQLIEQFLADLAEDGDLDHPNILTGQELIDWAQERGSFTVQVQEHTV